MNLSEAFSKLQSRVASALTVNVIVTATHFKQLYDDNTAKWVHLKRNC